MKCEKCQTDFELTGTAVEPELGSINRECVEVKLKCPKCRQGYYTFTEGWTLDPAAPGETIETVNPWLTQNQKSNPGEQTMDCADRVRYIRQCDATEEDMAWLKQVIAWGQAEHRNQKTVQDAAERRLRTLERQLQRSLVAE